MAARKRGGEKFDGKVGDADGRLRSDDPRARDHFSSGRVEPIELEPGWLTIEEMRTIAAIRARR
jgi:hypothetical protein